MPATQVLAQLAREVDVNQSFREVPRAIHPREAIVIAAGENDLERERCGCLQDGEIRSRRRSTNSSPTFTVLEDFAGLPLIKTNPASQSLCAIVRRRQSLLAFRNRSNLIS